MMLWKVFAPVFVPPRVSMLVVVALTMPLLAALKVRVPVPLFRMMPLLLAALMPTCTGRAIVASVDPR